MEISFGFTGGDGANYSATNPTTVGLAAAELILAIEKEFSNARLVPCEPVEGQDIHLWAYLPIAPEEGPAAQGRIVEIEHAVQGKYGVDTVVAVIPDSS